MKIQAELSLYPLKTESVEDVVGRFIDELGQAGISVSPGSMSTLLAGECEDVFLAVSQCFNRACRDNEVVLSARFSNACPENPTLNKQKK